jgi:hypothetical protein
MKFNYIFLSLVFLLSIKTSQAQDTSIKINFIQVEKFTDFQSQENKTVKNQTELMKELTKLMEKSISTKIPKGYKMEVNISNVDMAGRYTYGGGQAVRVVQDTDRVTMAFNYQLYNIAGEVISEGDLYLNDRNPQVLKRRAVKYKYTNFPLEMALFNNWLNKLKIAS